MSGLSAGQLHSSFDNTSLWEEEFAKKEEEKKTNSNSSSSGSKKKDAPPSLEEEEGKKIKKESFIQKHISQYELTPSVLFPSWTLSVTSFSFRFPCFSLFLIFLSLFLSFSLALFIS